MRKKLLLLGAFGMLTTATLCAQEFHLQPTPQEYITQKDSVDIPRQYQILSGNSVQDGPALPLLRSLMPEEVLGASFRVYIGVKGDKIIKKYKKDILLANSESHRFAINYHTLLRNKNFLK
jgi:hyaluronoglucosaminidase